MPVKLTPEDLEKVQTKKVANVLRKLHAGKTLTAREDALLAAASAGGGIDAAGYVGTWDELAARLEVTRKAIQNWRSDPRYAPEIARRKDLLERSDGRHCVAEWLRLMVDLGLKRGKAAAEAQDGPENDRDEDPGIIRPPPVGGTQAEWQKAILHEKHAKERTNRLTAEGTLLVAAELEVPLGAFLAALQAKLNQFPDMAARRVRGIADEAECREHLRDEIDAVASDIQLGRYLADDVVATAVAAVPFDAATEALCAKLLFSGSDRAALLELAGAIALEAVRRIGRIGIAHSRRLQGEAEIIVEPVSASETVAVSESAEPAPAPPVKATEIAPSSKAEASAAGKPKRRRKARPQPTPPPPGIEGAIVNERTKATRRRR